MVIGNVVAALCDERAYVMLALHPAIVYLQRATGLQQQKAALIQKKITKMSH
jgi:hypothetical protein